MHMTTFYMNQMEPKNSKNLKITYIYLVLAIAAVAETWEIQWHRQEIIRGHPHAAQWGSLTRQGGSSAPPCHSGSPTLGSRLFYHLLGSWFSFLCTLSTGNTGKGERMNQTHLLQSRGDAHYSHWQALVPEPVSRGKTPRVGFKWVISALYTSPVMDIWGTQNCSHSFLSSTTRPCSLKK